MTITHEEMQSHFELSLNTMWLHCPSFGDSSAIALLRASMYHLLWKSAQLHSAEEVVRAGVFLSILHQVVRA